MLESVKSAGQRVVVTGLGALTPLGHSVTETWGNLVKGRSGIDFITLFEAGHLSVRFAGEVKNFDPLAYLSVKEVRRMARCTQFAIPTAFQAMTDAGLSYPLPDELGQRCGVLLGTGMGGFDRAEQGIKVHLEQGLHKVNPFSLPASLPNLSTYHVCVKLNAQG
ncbi:MAG: beta-ketoacyl synthase N-terminal-like domain-containing protein, partial [Chloroflexota bacterium]